MALGAFFKGLINLITGGFGSLFMNSGSFSGALNDAGTALSQWGELGYDISQGNMLGNYLSKMTGSRLTDAEREANSWNEMQVLSAWNRQMEADNTKYQRQVQDMQAAGLNPMLATGVSPHVPTAAVASSVSPSAAAFNFGDLINLIKLGSEIKNINADTASKSANAAKATEEAKGTAIENQFKSESLRLRNEAYEVGNSVSRLQASKITKELDDIDASIRLKVKQAETEESKQSLMSAQALLARMNARQAAEMLPYLKAYNEAQTAAARQSAALAAAECLYKNNLISSGYIDSLADEMYGKSRSANAMANVDEIKSGFRTGDFGESSPVAKWYQEDNKLATRIVNTVTNILDNLNPVANLFVGAFGN